MVPTLQVFNHHVCGTKAESGEGTVATEYVSCVIATGCGTTAVARFLSWRGICPVASGHLVVVFPSNNNHLPRTTSLYPPMAW